MKDKELKSKLSKLLESTEGDINTEVVFTATPIVDNFLIAATEVMASYQNANKWLDIIKEYLLMDCGCVFFSNYVHNLAHSMPIRFDKFGDILHTIDMKVPYPATNYIENMPSDIPSSFDMICSILDAICESLKVFIDISNTVGHRAVAIASEDLMVDISTEYTNLKRMRRAYDQCNGDTMKFDKWCAQYMNNLNTLID